MTQVKKASNRAPRHNFVREHLPGDEETNDGTDHDTVETAACRSSVDHNTAANGMADVMGRNGRINTAGQKYPSFTFQRFRKKQESVGARPENIS
ncbi:MAG: hypothetical protein ACK4FJ_17560 [Ferrovibrio sp.]|uniref:hypothetical protein n=1 Tax=Ferrovibrio sp. TaxID=1917215 RepID=UPI00391C4F87